MAASAEKSAPGKIVRQKVVPLEVGSVWNWVKNFNQDWIPRFPAIQSIEVLASQSGGGTSKKDGTKTSAGTVRSVKVKVKDEIHVLKEKLEFCKNGVYTIIYTLLEYTKPGASGGSDDKKEPAVDVKGTMFTMKLKGCLSDVDLTPETRITWICSFDPTDRKLQELAETVLVAPIDSCLQEYERQFNQPVGVCKVFLKSAKNLITADVFSSDPYCMLRMSDMAPDKAQKSRVKKWTKNPTYNEEFELEVRPRSLKLIISFWDLDGSGDDDDPMGSAETEFRSD